jgi:hypothetical protein
MEQMYENFFFLLIIKTDVQIKTMQHTFKMCNFAHFSGYDSQFPLAILTNEKKC